MSIKVMNDVLNLTLKPSTLKFILVILANYSNEKGLVYPSISTLVNKTGQDRKTVEKNMNQLKNLGYLTDTGERKGKTHQVIVYELALNKLIPPFVTKKKQPQNSVEIPPSLVEKKEMTHPKNGGQNINYTTKERRTHKSKHLPPNWLKNNIWCNWLDFRVKIQHPMDEQQQYLLLQKIELWHQKGHTAEDISNSFLDSMMNNYRGVFEPKTAQSSRTISHSKMDQGVAQMTLLNAQKARTRLFGEKR